jgi:hypothetical protein
MRPQNSEPGMVNFLRASILCLAIILAACSHDRVAATETPAAERAITKPAATEPTKPELVTEKPPATQTAVKEISILKPGQSTNIDASTKLHYVRVVSDSRCPAGVQCIWAGEATIELMFESGKEKQTFSLTNRANTKSMMGFSIEMVSIDRDHLINIRAQKL